MSMSGKTVVITGCTHGLGLQAMEQLVRLGARVLALCRNLPLAEEVRADILTRIPDAVIVIHHCDLGDPASVIACAQAVNSTESKIDVLVNNAATVFNEFQMSKEGYEMQFQINVLGPFLLTSLLQEKIVSSAPSRIVVVSSNAYKYVGAQFDCQNVFVQEPKKYAAFKAYSYTKLANAYFGVELARRLSGMGVDVYIVHPGVVKTNLGRDIIRNNCCLRGCVQIFKLCMLNPERGTRSIMRCTCDPELQGQSGRYYVENGSEVAFTTDFQRHQETMTKNVWQFCETASAEIQKNETSGLEE